ncbi:Uncharacterised protein [Mycobacteroides abscessus]|nr:Uncharacterised protein [Mycobacteroides abscessus]
MPSPCWTAFHGPGVNVPSSSSAPNDDRSATASDSANCGSA